MKGRRILACAAVLAASLVAAQPAQAGRSDDWAAIADEAITKFQAADTGTETAHAYAYILGAIARRHGWEDPRIPGYLAKLYALRNPDGGWGLNYAWDAFGDGTVNPATTTYTVTLADHVGPVLLDAYQAGLVPAADIQTIVDLLMSTQSGRYASYGRCIAYSRSAHDRIANHNGYCVHNVNATAAAFLHRASVAGFAAPDLRARIAAFAVHEATHYTWVTPWWPYRASGSPGDTDHTAAEADAVYEAVAYPLGREVAQRILIEGLNDNAKAPIAHMRLTGLPPAPGSMSGDTTLWCVLGDRWIAEAAAFVAAPPSTRALAQAAYWASRNAAVC